MSKKLADCSSLDAVLDGLCRRSFTFGTLIVSSNRRSLNLRRLGETFPHLDQVGTSWRLSNFHPTGATELIPYVGETSNHRIVQRLVTASCADHKRIQAALTVLLNVRDGGHDTSQEELFSDDRCALSFVVLRLQRV